MDTPDSIPMRRCTKCGTEFPATAEFFVRQPEKKIGLSSQCRGCIRLRNRAAMREYRKSPEFREQEKERYATYYQSNQDEILARKRERARLSPEEKEARRTARLVPANVKRERRQIYLAQYRESHHEQRRAYGREYDKRPHVRQKHSARLAVWTKTEEGRRYHAAKQRERRARIASADGTHTALDIELQYRSQKGRCWWCGNELGAQYDVDHVIPLKRGGSHGPENLVVSCATCNRSKGSKLPSEWAGRLL